MCATVALKTKVSWSQVTLLCPKYEGLKDITAQHSVEMDHRLLQKTAG
jgi:hypothetical protein